MPHRRLTRKMNVFSEIRVASEHRRQLATMLAVFEG